jgi:hypothetical protein
MLEAQATTVGTAIARHFASCDILPRSAWPTESRRAGLAKNIETLTNSGARDPAGALQQPVESLPGVTQNEKCIEKRQWRDKCD